MPYKYCQHVKENGTFCTSPALRSRKYCYFHLRWRGRRLSLAQARSQGKPWNLVLPPLEDMQAVQASLIQVVEALAAGCLDPQRAGLILYGLQQASTNLKSMQGWVGRSPFAVNTEDDLRAINYPGLEAEFALPKQLDIDTPPELAFPPLIAATEVSLEPAPVKKLPRGVKTTKLPAELLVGDA
jgi:hypothetical protein